MSILYDDDFQSYTVGANPPYGNMLQVSASPPSIANTTPGIYGDAKSVQMPAGGVALIYPTQTPDNTLPAYIEATVLHGLFISADGTDEEGTLLEFDSNLTAFAGATCATVLVSNDGTLSVEMDGVVPKVSNFSLLRNGWYMIQHNLTFFDAGGNLACTFEIGVNGISVLAGTLISTRLTSTMPAIWWNNLRVGGCGSGFGSLMGRLTVYDTVQPIGTAAHAGTPEARITDGVIELVISPDKWRVYEA